MIVKGKIRDYNKKIDNLIQSVIVNYSQDIDFNNEIELYDRLVYLLANGVLNKEFNSDYLNKLDIDEEKKIFNLVREYSSLCFKDKYLYNWRNSCQDVISTDYRYICIRLVDNYDFLVNLTVDGGENALRLLDNFSIYDVYRSYSVVEILRNNYNSDDILKKVIIDMSRDNSKFNIFSLEQKALLCYYGPEILYSKRGDLVTFKAPSSIALELYKFVYKKETKPTIDELRFYLKDINDFESVLTKYLMQRKN